MVGRTDLHYHFWALRAGPREPITGMASFFVMQKFEFGGTWQSSHRCEAAAVPGSSLNTWKSRLFATSARRKGIIVIRPFNCGVYVKLLLMSSLGSWSFPRLSSAS